RAINLRSFPINYTLFVTSLCKDTKNRTVFLMFGCLSLVAVWSLKMKNAGVLAKTCRTFL
ncbi:hypothetical protein, partial [Phocaeicola coprocola]|uniref:hypothetical protein n=1 Tax=Phocaeicola coprocola TaxID=310298 RepID=UPI0026652E13